MVAYSQQNEAEVSRQLQSTSADGHFAITIPRLQGNRLGVLLMMDYGISFLI